MQKMVGYGVQYNLGRLGTRRIVKENEPILQSGERCANFGYGELCHVGMIYRSALDPTKASLKGFLPAAAGDSRPFGFVAQAAAFHQMEQLFAQVLGVVARTLEGLRHE